MTDPWVKFAARGLEKPQVLLPSACSFFLPRLSSSAVCYSSDVNVKVDSRVRTFCPQLMTLFGEVIGPLGDGTKLMQVGCLKA